MTIRRHEPRLKLNLNIVVSLEGCFPRAVTKVISGYCIALRSVYVTEKSVVTE